MPSRPAPPARGVILQPGPAGGAPKTLLKPPFFETAMKPEEIKQLDFTCDGFAVANDGALREKWRTRPARRRSRRPFERWRRRSTPPSSWV